MSCQSCARGFHAECLNGCKKCHPKAKQTAFVEGTTESRKHGTTAINLKDPKSTGRKRAAQLYPLDRDASCEWQGQKNCGGGKRPVVGCAFGKQQHRHHGPIKDTTKNFEGNVHRICTACHNHWHELNDLVYDERAYSLLPHDPSEASPQEIVNAELDWRNGVMGRKYELASSKNRLDFAAVD